MGRRCEDQWAKTVVHLRSDALADSLRRGGPCIAARFVAPLVLRFFGYDGRTREYPRVVVLANRYLVKMRSPLEKLRAVARRVNVPILQKFAWNYEWQHLAVKVEPCPVCASLVLDHVPSGATIVELGCGTGVFAQEVFRRGWVGRYIGIDLSDAALTVAKTRCPQGEWRIGNMRSALGFTPYALLMIDSVYYLPPATARTVLENAKSRVSICRIFNRFAKRGHSDMLLDMGFQEQRVGDALGVFCRLQD